MTLKNISHSPEADFVRSTKFLKFALVFKSKFSDIEIKKMLSQLKYPYHYFKIGNAESYDIKTSLNFQMRIAPGIPLIFQEKQSWIK